MDAFEATKVVMSRIQSFDPENAWRIIGYILIQDQGEKEIIRLAFSSDSVLLSCINRGKACLGLASNIPSNGFSTTPLNPIMPNYPLLPQTSPQNMVPNNGFHLSNLSPKPVSYVAAPNGSNTGCNNGIGSSNLNVSDGNDFGYEFSFLDDSEVDQNPIKSPNGRSDSLVLPYSEDVNNIPSSLPHPLHRASCSRNDAAFLANLEEGGGVGVGVGGVSWKPCVYFARGFCKNGNSCRFLHVETPEVGSSGLNNSVFDEFFRIKAVEQRQRLGFLAPYENQRYDHSARGHDAAERQVYLTFPADSTFTEEDVSAYFSKFGPVQDVRIPHQQRNRMFGFVTFVQPETVKLILSKGNPHYVRDCRVLVKQYKDKARLLDEKQFGGPSLAPTGSTILHEIMLTRKLEHQAEIQHAIERRMMDLQLMNVDNHNHDHPFLPTLPVGIPLSSPRQSRLLTRQPIISESNCQDIDGTDSSNNDGTVSGSKQQHINEDNCNFSKSLEHVLTENPFASPINSNAEIQFGSSTASAEADNSIPVTNASSNNFPSST